MCSARSARDLPEAGSVQARNVFLAEARKSGSVFFVCVAIWLLTGAGYFWPMWVLLFVGLKIGRLARHAYGGSGHDDRDEFDAYDGYDADLDASASR